MTDFRPPDDIMDNHRAVTDPAGLVESLGARAWLFQCGDEFAAMEGGLSCDDVVAVVDDYKAFVVDALARLADDSSHGDQSR